MAPGHKPLSLCRTFGWGDRPLHPSLPCRGFLRGVCTPTLSNRFPLSSPRHRTNSKFPPPCPGTAPHSSSTACSFQVSAHVRVYKHTHTDTHSCMHDTHVHIHIHTERPMHVAHIPMHTCVYLHTHMHAYIQTSQPHTGTHMPHTHTHAHTKIHGMCTQTPR